MHTTTLALTLGLALLANPAAPPDPGYPTAGGGTTRDFEKPPPGSAADQALWQSSYDVNNDLAVIQHTTQRNQLQVRGTLERLLEASERSKLAKPEADRLTALLTNRLVASAELMVSTWPVSKQRVCRYEHMNLEGVMLGAASPSKEVQLADARRDLSTCVTKATSVLATVRKMNDELLAANAEAERVIGPPSTKAASAAQK